MLGQITPEIKEALERVSGFYLKIPPPWSYRAAGRAVLADYHDAVDYLVKLMQKEAGACTEYAWSYGDFCYACGKTQDEHKS